MGPEAVLVAMNMWSNNLAHLRLFVTPDATRSTEFTVSVLVLTGESVPGCVTPPVGLPAHRAQGLGGGALRVVIPGDVNIEAVFILHLTPALLAPEPGAGAPL